MVAHRLAALAVIVVSIAAGGCGSSHPAAPRTTATAHPAASGCIRAVAAALVAAEHGAAVEMIATPPSPGVRGCRYVTDNPTSIATISIDENPQAFRRYYRAVVETDQNALWSSTRKDAPRDLEGIAKGANWFPGYAQLLSSDGRRLLDVRVQRGRDPERIARAITVATLAALASRP
jgi:hypothetical protein